MVINVIIAALAGFIAGVMSGCLITCLAVASGRKENDGGKRRTNQRDIDD